MRDAFVFDRELSFQQDFAFGLQQLSSVTIRDEKFTGRGSNGSVRRGSVGDVFQGGGKG
ncbi:MAG: hypothetical protein ACRDTR_15105 [Rubrobacter sp.]